MLSGARTEGVSKFYDVGAWRQQHDFAEVGPVSSGGVDSFQMSTDRVGFFGSGVNSRPLRADGPSAGGVPTALVVVAAQAIIEAQTLRRWSIDRWYRVRTEDGINSALRGIDYLDPDLAQRLRIISSTPDTEGHGMSNERYLLRLLENPATVSEGVRLLKTLVHDGVRFNFPADFQATQIADADQWTAHVREEAVRAFDVGVGGVDLVDVTNVSTLDGSLGQKNAVRSLLTLLGRGQLELAHALYHFMNLESSQDDDDRSFVNALIHIAAIQEDFTEERSNLIKEVLHLISFTRGVNHLTWDGEATTEAHNFERLIALTLVYLLESKPDVTRDVILGNLLRHVSYEMNRSDHFGWLRSRDPAAVLEREAKRASDDIDNSRVALVNVIEDLRTSAARSASSATGGGSVAASGSVRYYEFPGPAHMTMADGPASLDAFRAGIDAVGLVGGAFSSVSRPFYRSAPSTVVGLVEETGETSGGAFEASAGHLVGGARSSHQRVGGQVAGARIMVQTRATVRSPVAAPIPVRTTIGRL